jgi:DNA repair protein RecO (recombination protein O)
MTNPERSIRVDAVVLRHKEWGEADRIITLFTHQKGKLRAVAKGVRKLTSRKSGHLEPFTRVELQLARGKDFWIVTQAETITANPEIHADLAAVGFASYVCELIDRFLLEDERNENLYKLLLETLMRIGKQDDQLLAIRFFEMHLLDILGYKPRLMTCVYCSKEIKPEDQYFSIEQGGVICPGCAGRSSIRIPVSMDALRYLRHLQRSPFGEAARALIPPKVMEEMEKIMQAYLTYLLEQKIHSTNFIQLLRDQESQKKILGN